MMYMIRVPWKLLSFIVLSAFSIMHLPLNLVYFLQFFQFNWTRLFNPIIHLHLHLLFWLWFGICSDLYIVTICVREDGGKEQFQVPAVTYVFKVLSKLCFLNYFFLIPSSSVCLLVFLLYFSVLLNLILLMC